jgi:hypothetical protein
MQLGCHQNATKQIESNVDRKYKIAVKKIFITFQGKFVDKPMNKISVLRVNVLKFM